MLLPRFVCKISMASMMDAFSSVSLSLWEKSCAMLRGSSVERYEQWKIIRPVDNHVYELRRYSSHKPLEPSISNPRMWPHEKSWAKETHLSHAEIPWPIDFIRSSCCLVTKLWDNLLYDVIKLLQWVWNHSKKCSYITCYNINNSLSF